MREKSTLRASVFPEELPKPPLPPRLSEPSKLGKGLDSRVCTTPTASPRRRGEPQGDPDRRLALLPGGRLWAP